MAAFPASATHESDPSPDPAKHIKQLRDEAGTLRAQAETSYQTAKSACQKRFFVTSCIDDAKAERLTVIRRARELEAQAHQIDLAERRRRADEVAKKAEEHGSGPRPTEASLPSADQEIAKPRPEIVTITSPHRITRPSASSNGASERAKAARRAEAAQRDRERYDARIRELEEKKARDADGR